MTRIYEINDITKSNIKVKNIFEEPKSSFLFDLFAELTSPFKVGAVLHNTILGQPKKEKAPKTTEDKVGSFLVYVDDLEYAQQLIWAAQDLGLTVNGDNLYKMRSYNSISNLKEGQYIEFFGNCKYDVDWTANEEWALSVNYKKAYILSESIDIIIEKVDKAAKEKKRLLKKGWPTQPTYRALKQEELSGVERTSLATKEEKKSTYSVPKTSVTQIRVSNNFYEVDGKLYSKKMNDRIYIL